MKKKLIAAALGLASMGVNAQVSTVLCTYKGVDIPLTINYTSSTVTNMYNEVNPATITNTYIEFIDGKNTQVTINRFTGLMVLNNHNDKPLKCTETRTKF